MTLGNGFPFERLMKWEISFSGIDTKKTLHNKLIQHLMQQQNHGVCAKNNRLAVVHIRMIKNNENDREVPSSLRSSCMNPKKAGSMSDDYQSNTTFLQKRVDEAESIVAKALGSLSLGERSQLLDDVHGVSKPIDETPDTILSSLTAFAAAIESSKTPMYEKALVQNKSYVEDRSLRLMFLRSEGFNVHAAVNRLMLFLKQKALYFGEEKLTKEITLDDFSAEDMQSLESGATQVLPKEDRAGRSIFVVFPQLRKHKDPKKFMRATFFVEMCTFRDVEVQKKGAVCIFYNTAPKRVRMTDNDMDTIKLAKQHRAAMPIRCVAFHTCVFERKGGFALDGVSLSTREQDCAKTNVHYGNDNECMLELRRFGIPTECFPVTSDGSTDVQPHQEWVKQKKAELQIPLDLSSLSATSLETWVGMLRALASKNDFTEVCSLSHGIICNETVAASRSQVLDVKALHRAADLAPNSYIQPTLTDVLLGRGRHFQEFPGNIAFRAYLEDRTDEYDKADNAGKSMLTKSIVRSFYAAGTRFLRLSAPANGIPSWEEANSKEVCRKVSQCYRSARRKEKKDICRLNKKNVTG